MGAQGQLLHPACDTVTAAHQHSITNYRSAWGRTGRGGVRRRRAAVGFLVASGTTWIRQLRAPTPRPRAERAPRAHSPR